MLQVGNGEAEYERGNDILDIWFDSGSTWAAVLGGANINIYTQRNEFYLVLFVNFYSFLNEMFNNCR